ncbi:unnamed protein product [Phaeothamnion confervicola]
MAKAFGRFAFHASRQQASFLHTRTCLTTRGGAAATADAVADAVKNDNPLLKQESLPLFDKIDASSVVPAIETLLSNLEQNFGELEKGLASPETGEVWGKKRYLYDYETSVEALERIRAPLEYSWGVVGHLNGVKNSDELREAYQAMQPKVIQAMQKLTQSPAVYAALKHLQKPVSSRLLSEPQRRIVDASVRAMDLAGVGLAGDAKEHFNAIQLELGQLSTTFTNNVLDATKAFSLVVTDPADIKGLPDSTRALLAQSAKVSGLRIGVFRSNAKIRRGFLKMAGEESATPGTGPWRITLDLPSYLPCMQHLESRNVREKLYRAHITRASSGDVDNRPIIARILALRQEMAGLLGFSSFAEVSLASKMAPSVGAVDELSEMLREKSYPAAVREMKALRAYAAAKGFEGELALWDVTYWSERQKEELYSVSAEQLRPYFPLPSVLTGMFGLAERLFGVRIEAADGDAPIWHPDVRYFRVASAESGEQIASFYLDPYSRPENKRGGAWMDVCMGRSRVMGRIPVAYLTCNGSPPVGEKPSLMTFQEVETAFHEFGHGLQHMLTNVEDGDAAGINNVEWDAVELPSQFMENWCYHRPTVMSFARHYETGELLPAELFEKLDSLRTFMAGSGMLRQLYLGQTDMELHHRFDAVGAAAAAAAGLAPGDGAPADAFAVQRGVAERFTVIPPLDVDRFLCSFTHIFAGGYSAGYFSYKWAEVLSADAFAAFEEAGLDNEAAVTDLGRRFRETVLGMGGGKHPSEVFRAYRGRDPEPEALLRHSGLLAAAAG